MFAHVLRGVPQHATSARGAAVAHQLPGVSPPDARAGLPDTEPAQQHQGDGGLPALHGLGPPAAGRSAALPAPAAPGPGCAPAGGGFGWSGVQQSGNPLLHHRVHRYHPLTGLGAVRQLPEL